MLNPETILLERDEDGRYRALSDNGKDLIYVFTGFKGRSFSADAFNLFCSFVDRRYGDRFKVQLLSEVLEGV